MRLAEAKRSSTPARTELSAWNGLTAERAKVTSSAAPRPRLRGHDRAVRSTTPAPGDAVLAARRARPPRMRADDGHAASNPPSGIRARIRRCGEHGVLKEFRDFALRGNVVDLAVAIVIGTAFTSLVQAFVPSFISPLISMFVGKSGSSTCTSRSTAPTSCTARSCRRSSRS
jgi:hypothetical protein